MPTISLRSPDGARVWIAYVDDARVQILTGRVGHGPADEEILVCESAEAAQARARALADEQIAHHGFAVVPQPPQPDPRFPGLADRLDVEIIDLVWNRGRLVGVTLQRDGGMKTDLAKLTERVLSLPVARSLRSLRFGFAKYDKHGTLTDWTQTFAVVAASRQAGTLHTLAFDYISDERVPLDSTIIGDLSGHWDAFPRLEVLSLRGIAATLGELRLPALHTFRWETTELSDQEVVALERAELPKLRTLELVGIDDELRERIISARSRHAPGQARSATPSPPRRRSRRRS